MTHLPHWTAGLHHDGSGAYVSNPLPGLNETITLTLRTPADAPIERVFLRAMVDGEFERTEAQCVRRTTTAQYWTVALTMTQPRMEYRFKLLTPQGAWYYTSHGCSRADSPDYFDFFIQADYDAPLWVREQVFYQIFPERFHNGDPSNDVQDGDYTRRGFTTMKREWHEEPLPWRKAGSMDFFGGDLQGIAQKLDYLQELGVTALYLCPIFHAESNHKYDIIDFYNVDPHFGGNEALAELREAMQQRGMKLMLDVTTNHISFHHPWYTAARDNPQAESREFFYIHPDTNTVEHWLGVPSLIKLNYTSQRLRDVMYRKPDSVLKKWLRAPYGADAWRLDVANMTGNFAAGQHDHDVWREVRQELKAEFPDVYLLGEYFQDGTPHLQGEELDASMNYQGFNTPVRRWLGGEDLGVSHGKDFGDRTLLPTEALVQQWQNFLAALPYPIALQQFNQLDSHDTSRILSVVGGDKALAKLGVALLLAFPGVPCLYYATEIAMPGAEGAESRRPMPWGDASKWDQEMVDFTKTLIELRKRSPALQHGSFQVIHAAGDVVAFVREAGPQRVIFVGHRGTSTLAQVQINVALAGIEDGTRFVERISGAAYAVEQGLLTLRNVAHGQALFLQSE